MGTKTLLELICFHLELRPLMQLEDVYKLLFQGIYGNGHSITKDALETLQREIEGLAFETDDPLTEPASLDGSLIRVNLRPYIQKGYSPELLFNAMVASSEYRGSPDSLLHIWDEFIGLCGQELSFEREQAARFSVPKGLPSHSRIYKLHYSPAYRVVARAVFESLLGNIL